MIELSRVYLEGAGGSRLQMGRTRFGKLSPWVVSFLIRPAHALGHNDWPVGTHGLASQ
jgi:hypothetical protein